MNRKIKLAVAGMVLAGAGAGALLTASGGRAEEPAAPPATERTRSYVYAQDGDIHIDAPGTYVRVNPASGALQVEAPNTSIVVSPDEGRAKVRALGVSLDLRW